MLLRQDRKSEIKIPATLASAVLLPLCLAALAATFDAPARNSYAAFNNQAGRVHEALGGLYGKDAGPGALPSEIASEVRWLSSEETALKSAFGKLAETGKSLDEEEDLQTRKEKILDIDYDSLRRERQPFEAKKAKIESDLEDWDGRAETHNRNKPNPENEAAVSSYNDEANAGNAEHERIVAELQDVENTLSGTFAQRELALQQRAIELAERRNYLDKRKEAFASDMSAFMARCDEATVRAQAFAEIAGEKPSNLIGGFSRVNEKRPNPIFEMGKSVGQDVLLASLAALVPEGSGPILAWGPAAAKVVVKLGEILPPGVDERTREVQDNVLLIGDYAKALKRLKDEGRLSQDDEGYKAIQKMLKERGQEMPGSTTGFIYQSEARVRTLESGLAEVAAHYAFKPVEPGPVKMTKRMAAREQELLKSYGEQLKRAVTKVEGAPGEAVKSLPVSKSPELIEKSKELVGGGLSDSEGEEKEPR